MEKLNFINKIYWWKDNVIYCLNFQNFPFACIYISLHISGNKCRKFSFRERFGKHFPVNYVSQTKLVLFNFPCFILSAKAYGNAEIKRIDQ